MNYRTKDRRVIPAVTADQMREIDRVAIMETGPNLFQMMENAGRNLATLTRELLGADWRSASIIVLAGTGGNGGGGICAARHLSNHGAGVTLAVTDVESLGEVPRWQYSIYTHTDGKIVTEPGGLRPHLIVDALVGYGLKSAPRGRVAELIRWANGSGAPIVALDVPSGVDATTGDAPGDAITARWTMTLALPKTGLLPKHAGMLYLADIGIPIETFRRAGVGYVSPFETGDCIPLVIGDGEKENKE